MAGLSAAKKRGKRGGRPKAISKEKMQAILEALNSGTSKAAICRTFNVKRTTLYDALKSLTSSDGLNTNPMADLVPS
jgi:DNA invertase Pin-like site-specific DNA recombinase